MLPKRIAKETATLLQDPPPGIQASPHPSNARHFCISLKGPAETPYEGGTFSLELYLPLDYPMSPPKVRFLTPVFHPNIDRLGRICLDILKDKWSPALQIRTVLLSIQALMGLPNPDDPLNADAAQLWHRDLEGALRAAREFTQKHAMQAAVQGEN